MRIFSVRDLEGLRPVLKTESSTGPDPVYWVFKELGHNRWANMTIITPGKYDGEYAKTFGHYHSDQGKETYHVVSGKGLFILQKYQAEKGLWIGDDTQEILLVRATTGDEVNISPTYAHSLINIGDSPLISYDDRQALHPPSDYSPIDRLHGLAYYIIEENSQPKAVPNPHYQNLPEPTWTTAKEFQKVGGEKK